ncbi:P-loop containing nucleoside triphosphate hydrolase protein [Amylocarpus encephaloides]|uniref:RNA helicase n=1 Tax=Amylocarpus encephaloides TaxID=45428 RepID=A0A9P7YJK8_9HELO|nr:P-loop containing nucleoside triphosphate hydrolase protein [Amylocarpus encephaloides]
MADDFVFTLSDNEEDLNAAIEEELIASPPPLNKKRKRGVETSKKSKKAKKGSSGEPETTEDANDGIWGAKDEDDGAMDLDFEFAMEGGEDDLQEFDGWGFDSAKQSLTPTAGAKRTVDIEDIIARRREKMKGKGDVEGSEDESDNSEPEMQETGGDIELDNSGDEFMAEDGFGMGADSADEDSDNQEASEVEVEEEDEDSDDDSVASAVPHPDDLAFDAPSDLEDTEDPAEAARRKAFFAPEEKLAKGAKQASDMTFQDMSLSRPILRGLAAVGFSQPTPIQAKTVPVALLGKDVVGGAVTGSGKTAAFIVPVLERLLYRPKKVPTSRVVILMPTRELAIQCHAVATKLASHTDIRFCLAVGGLSLKVQEAELRLRPDVIIATPGRFIDHMRNSPSFTVDTLEILVLDEADRMLEAGFADELNEILTTIPKSRQTMLFSATMTSSVDNLIRVGLNKPVRILVDSQKQTVGTLVQEFVRLRPGRETKRMGYLLCLCAKVYTDRVIVFFRQKKEAHRARVIFGLSGLKATELHGSMSQDQRIASVEAFRDGKASFLLATDLASRGLDIKGVDTVINYEAPQSHDIYLHRVGRTARAGRAGRACTLAAEPDRKIVKAAVKSARAQGAKIASRVIESSDADKWALEVENMQDDIEEILKEEKEDKELAQVEMQVKKGENMINHESEIASRPKRTWFESEVEKTAAKNAGRAALNGAESVLKKKPGKLSNKDKKKLDDRDARMEGKVWKKGRKERDGKGALENAKKEKGRKKEKGGKLTGKPTKGKFGKKR